MKRRALLAALGSASLSGCSGLLTGSESTPTPTTTETAERTETATATEPEETPEETPGPDYAWQYEPGGWIDGFADGMVFCREHWNPEDSEGRVVALDGASGEPRWDYGFADGFVAYSPLLVEDAVYFGRLDDQIAGGEGAVYALEHDGTERWTYPDASSLDREPILVDGVLYAAGDAGEVRAFDAEEGTLLWENTDLPSARSTRNRVVHVGDVVYVLMRHLFALDPDTGERQWSHEYGDSRYGPAVAVRDGVAYVFPPSGEQIIALDPDGTERWRRSDVMASAELCGDLLVAESTDDTPTLYGIETATGEDRWSVQDPGFDVLECTRDRVFGWNPERGRLVVLDTDDGSEVGTESFGDEGFRDIWTTDGAPGTAFAETDEDSLYRVSSRGDVTWRQQIGDSVIDLVVHDGDVYVGTEERITRFDPE